jgi:hypothetical protein
VWMGFGDALLRVPLCPLWLTLSKSFYHEGHEGAQREES